MSPDKNDDMIAELAKCFTEVYSEELRVAQVIRIPAAAVHNRSLLERLIAPSPDSMAAFYLESEVLEYDPFSDSFYSPRDY